MRARGALGEMSESKRRNPATLAAIIDAALTAVDRYGVEHVTIRNVAEIAGMSPMSLYRYVASKEELLDYMYQEATRRVFDTENPPTWQAGLLAVCHKLRRVLREHPNWGALLTRVATPPDMPTTTRAGVVMGCYTAFLNLDVVWSGSGR